LIAVAFEFAMKKKLPPYPHTPSHTPYMHTTHTHTHTHAHTQPHHKTAVNQVAFLALKLPDYNV
jgi:hypothetical protein